MKSSTRPSHKISPSSNATTWFARDVMSAKSWLTNSMVPPAAEIFRMMLVIIDIPTSSRWAVGSSSNKYFLLAAMASHRPKSRFCPPESIYGDFSPKRASPKSSRSFSISAVVRTPWGSMWANPIASSSRTVNRENWCSGFCEDHATAPSETRWTLFPSSTNWPTLYLHWPANKHIIEVFPAPLRPISAVIFPFCRSNVMFWSLWRTAIFLRARPIPAGTDCGCGEWDPVFCDIAGIFAPDSVSWITASVAITPSSVIMLTVSTQSTTSCRLWSTMRMIRSWERSDRMRSCNSVLPATSRFAVGSSRSNTEALRAKAQAIAKRCRCPPDKFHGLWLATSCSPTEWRAWLTRSSISWAGTWWNSKVAATSSTTRRQVTWLSGSCPTYATSPKVNGLVSLVASSKITTLPAQSAKTCSGMSPAIIRMRLLFPDPDGPVKRCTVPAVTRKLTS